MAPVSLQVGGKCAGEDCRGAGADERTMVGDSGVDAGEELGMVGESEGEGERAERWWQREKESRRKWRRSTANSLAPCNPI